MVGENRQSPTLVCAFKSKPPYQLYGLYLADRESSEQDLERAKTEMDTSTIKDASIDGYKGIEGLTDGRLFSVSTIPPTPENKELTEQILATFDFQ